MELEDYENEISKIEDEIKSILTKLKIKIPFDRFISFSSLFLYSEKPPYKLIGSETYENLETGKRTTIKVQVIHLGSNKLKKMKMQEIHERVRTILQLDMLYNQYNALTKVYESKAWFTSFSDIAYQNISDSGLGIDNKNIEKDNKELFVVDINDIFEDINKIKPYNKYSTIKDIFNSSKNEYYTETGNYLKN